VELFVAESHPGSHGIHLPAETANPAELIDYINAQAAKVQSMNATVDIDTTVGGEKRARSPISTDPRLRSRPQAGDAANDWFIADRAHQGV